MGLNIFFIIGAFFNPDISDSQLQGGIGIGQNGDPFIGMNRCAIVQIRADIDLLDAQSRSRSSMSRLAILPGKTPGSGLRITAPEQDHIAIIR